MNSTDLSKMSFTELVKMYRDLEENSFSLSLNDKVVVEIGGRSIADYVVSVIGGEGEDKDTVVLRNGSKEIIITHKK